MVHVEIFVYFLLTTTNYQYLRNSTGNFTTLCLQHVFTTTAGSVTMKVRAIASAGTMTFYGTSNRTFSFVIEDIGTA
jgi:hypothetical protein